MAAPAAARAVKEEYEHYKMQLERSRTRYKIVEETVQPDDSIPVSYTHLSIEATGALMNHPGVATILATGGPGMVKAAYSCGKPGMRGMHKPQTAFVCAKR